MEDPWVQGIVNFSMLYTELTMVEISRGVHLCWKSFTSGERDTYSFLTCIYRSPDSLQTSFPYCFYSYKKNIIKWKNTFFQNALCNRMSQTVASDLYWAEFFVSLPFHCGLGVCRGWIHMMQASASFARTHLNPWHFIPHRISRNPILLANHPLIIKTVHPLRTYFDSFDK